VNSSSQWKTHPDVVYEHFVETHRSQGAFDDIGDRLGRSDWREIRSEEVVECRDLRAGRTILISDVLTRYSVASEESSSSWIALKHKSDGIKS
jgi:hypothetical protein